MNLVRVLVLCMCVLEELIKRQVITLLLEK